jgi:hypothetical protein
MFPSAVPANEAKSTAILRDIAVVLGIEILVGIVVVG